MSVFDTITALFQSIEEAVAFANRTEETYQRSVGASFTAFGADDVDAVARNIAGLYAADAAALGLVLNEFGSEGITEARYTTALERLASGKIGDTSWTIAELAANLAWRSGQAFRGLERLNRPINKSFAQLSLEERKSDRAKIQDGAQFILNRLQEGVTTSAAA